jgi:hypothetical protein
LGCIFCYTLDGSEPDESSVLYSEPLIINKSMQLKAKAFKSGFTNSIHAIKNFTIVNPEVNGVNYKYYHGKWETLPTFDNLQPQKQGKCFEINFRGINTAADNFGQVFTTTLKITKEADYTFYLASDDGSTLFIDGEKLIDNDSLHAVIEKTKTIHLAAGKHGIKVEYFENAGGEELKIQFSSPDMVKQVIPSDMLFLK